MINMEQGLKCTLPLHCNFSFNALNCISFFYLDINFLDSSQKKQEIQDYWWFELFANTLIVYGKIFGNDHFVGLIQDISYWKG